MQVLRREVLTFMKAFEQKSRERWRLWRGGKRSAYGEENHAIVA
jgi:hypothetical protein